MENKKSFVSKIFAAFFVLCLSVLVITIIMASRGKISSSDLGKIVTVDDFWPDIKEDRTKLTWAHAVNSKEKLRDSLANDATMMLEADVNIGTLKGSEAIVPIMAHPPANVSDISLKQFLQTVFEAVRKSKRKGIKLDFKSLDVVEESLKILKEHKDLNFPIWLNADILEGPGEDMKRKPVESHRFLKLGQDYFPQLTISVGWTTGAGKQKYAIDDINQMIGVLDQASLGQDKRITFPVRAAFVGQSGSELQELLRKTGSALAASTITVWSSVDDRVNFGSLASVMKQIGLDRIYLDIPAEQEKVLRALL